MTLSEEVLDTDLRELWDVDDVMMLATDVPNFPWLQVVGAVITSAFLAMVVVHLFKKQIDV